MWPIDAARHGSAHLNVHDSSERGGVQKSMGHKAPWVRSHSGTPALKTEDFSKRMGRFSKTQKWIY